MSIQFRLNLAIGLILAFGLVCMIGLILLDAKPRTQAENASTMLLTETLIKSSLLPLKEAPDPKLALGRLVGALKHLRHAAVDLQSEITRSGIKQPIDAEPGFLGWKPGPLDRLRIPVEVRGRIIDTIIITPKPSDELDEVWEAVQRIFQWGLLISVLMFLLTWLIVRRSMAPIHGLRDAMRRMKAGDFEMRVKETGPPEIKGICQSLNSLAEALEQAHGENQRLTKNMILIQDQERRDIARELHDELGPYLFAIRTDSALLGRELEKPVRDDARSKKLNLQILHHVDLLQQTNRRVLERLAPPGLTELGLAGALHAMIDMWRRHMPQVELAEKISGPLTELDQSMQLTIYRIVQEGLTNAFRHSAADRIAVIVDCDEIEPDLASRGLVNVVVEDNGKGRAGGFKEGFGLRAMRERVSALTGRMVLEPIAGDGTRLTVELPVRVLQEVAA